MLAFNTMHADTVELRRVPVVIGGEAFDVYADRLRIGHVKHVASGAWVMLLELPVPFEPVIAGTREHAVGLGLRTVAQLCAWAVYR